MKQKMMHKVLLSLVPIILLAAYLFGLRVFVLLGVVCLTGCLVEYAAMRLINGNKAKVTEAALVSCLLYTLTLPPSTPYWVAMLGIAFGLFFGKGVFGGFGRNIFNPALVGRCFVYISFPSYLTVRWSQPFAQFPGGLIRYDGGADVITGATPLIRMQMDGVSPGYLQLLLGHIAGSMGETSAILIILAGIYLILTKTASWKIMVACIVSFTILNTIFYLTGITVADPLFSLLTGGFLFAVIFMATEPVSAPSQESARILYGILIGLVASVIRQFSLFTEGIMFAILIVNAFAPLIDRQIREIKAKRKKVPA
jgi:Na+-transporting NADH:ubiquinone oxidoreductase subunit B